MHELILWILLVGVLALVAVILCLIFAMSELGGVAMLGLVVV